ncbi:MAG: hypothetical protein EBR94_08300 [Bacteroidetes bacterium]|jgi:hypothetical protein|nr:hypothetical protein [Bacteroidota bacterium]
MEIKSYEDMAWQLGINTIETVHRMKSAEFVKLGEEMLKAAKLIQSGGVLATQGQIYDAYQRCLRLMSYLQAVESMGLISASEYRDFEIQILSLTQRLQSAYKSLNPPENRQC